MTRVSKFLLSHLKQFPRTSCVYSWTQCAMHRPIFHACNGEMSRCIGTFTANHN